MKKKMSIQERDWSNHIKRLQKGFINRADERSAEHPRRKYNCRTLTSGRIRMRQD